MGWAYRKQSDGSQKDFSSQVSYFQLYIIFSNFFTSRVSQWNDNVVGRKMPIITIKGYRVSFMIKRRETHLYSRLSPRKGTTRCTPDSLAPAMPLADCGAVPIWSRKAHALPFARVSLPSDPPACSKGPGCAAACLMPSCN